MDGYTLMFAALLLSSGASPRRRPGHDHVLRPGLRLGGEVNSEVDAAYRTKYGRHSATTIARITSPVAGSTTMRPVPSGGADA